MEHDYLKRILTAKVYDVAVETPLEFAPQLSARLDNRLLLKREDTQSVFSFKLRGAYNKMAHLKSKELARGVIAASAGNHAQGVALAAQRLNCKAIIVMPVTTPLVKVNAVKARGAEVILFGESYSDAYTHALSLEKKLKLTFVHPFNDPDVIAGQGTIGMEILRQHQDPIHAIFVAIGGGGLIAGVAAYVKQVRPDIRIIGVQTKDSNAMYQSLQAGRRIALNEVGLFSDGTAVKQVGDETFRLTRQYVDDIVLVDTDEICAAIKDVFQDTRSILEPAGALAIAGAKAYVAQHNIQKQTLVAIACGANMNFDRLRFVAERADVGQLREALLAVSLPEERGSFKHFCALLGDHNLTEFNYRMAEGEQAHVFVGLQVQTRADCINLIKALSKHGFDSLDLTHDELAKTHLRHLVGGRVSGLNNEGMDNESLYRFEFPERPGVLMGFLSSMSPNWNISLFQYRNNGADYGRILVGLQVPPKEKKTFQSFLKTLGYPYWDETNNPAYKLFLR